MNLENWFTRKDHGDGILELCLNCAPVNAISAEILNDIVRMLDEMAADDSVRAVVISSALKVFSAGLDMKKIEKMDFAGQMALLKGLNTGFPALFSFPKPIVVAVNGAAIAGGLFFVLTADFRVAGPRAKFGLAEVRVGLDFPVAPMEIARNTLAPDALRRLMLTGQPMSATEATAAGIVDVLEPDDSLVLDRALRAARDLAANPPIAYAAIKRQIRLEALDRIDAGIAAGANTPEGGWFNDESKVAMQRMISGS